MSYTSITKNDLLVAPLRKDGRMIVSYPKSGRTWLNFALAATGIDPMFSHAGNSTNRREIGLPFRGIPDSMRDVPMVFLHRDPIDTAVSMFYQVTRRDLRRGSARWWRMLLPLSLRGAVPPLDIDAFVLHPLHGIEKICCYNRAFLDHVAMRDDCLILTYEELRRDPATGFQRVLDFWHETGVTGAELADLSTFEKMKKVEQDQSGPAVLKPAKADDLSSAKVRKGKVGGYKDELNPKTIARCYDILRAHGFSPHP